MKKLFAFLLLFSIFFLYQTVYAESERASVDYSAYQCIIDKLNEEFGTDIHFATPEESAEIEAQGDAMKRRPLPSLEVFERELRSAILEERIETEKAESMWKNAVGQEEVFQG